VPFTDDAPVSFTDEEEPSAISVTMDEDVDVEGTDAGMADLSSSPVPAFQAVSQTPASVPFDASAAIQKLRENGFPYNRKLVALATIVALYTGRQLPKDEVQMSNWDAPLDEKQQRCDSSFSSPSTA
jgi:hypothetical protein